MPDKTGIAFVDFRNGTFSLPRDSERLRGLMHRFHECGYERIVQVRPGVRK